MAYACFYYPLQEEHSFNTVPLFGENLETLERELQSDFSQAKIQVLDAQHGYMVHIHAENLEKVLGKVFTSLGFPAWAGEGSDYRSIERVLQEKGKVLRKPLLSCSLFQWGRR